MQKEQLSALMDGELPDSTLVSTLSNDQKLQQSWQSYHLIRDTLRDEVNNEISASFADRVAAALEFEPLYLGVSELSTNSSVAPDRKIIPLWKKLRPWGSQFMQIGIAASVSLAVLVGVQHYSKPTENEIDSDIPVFNTLPMGGQASPVSFGVPVNELDGEQQIQQQRKRINAILQDYELQRRLYSETPPDNSNVRVSIQVPGTLSLGTKQ